MLLLLRKKKYASAEVIKEKFASAQVADYLSLRSRSSTVVISLVAMMIKASLRIRGILALL